MPCKQQTDIGQFLETGIYYYHWYILLSLVYTIITGIYYYHWYILLSLALQTYQHSTLCF